MTTLAMTEAEEKSIDSKVEQMLDWAKVHKVEAEQLAFDATRLMSCTADRMDKLKGQGFFKRCWNRFSGEAGAMERANQADLVQMQKISLRYINMLQEQQMLMAHSMLSLKNNLLSLSIMEEETRNLVATLAQHTLERFKKLENRVDKLEVTTNLIGWLIALDERGYEEQYPTKYMRIFRIINDFYGIKNDEWTYNDLLYMRKAIRLVGFNPNEKLSLAMFIEGLTSEIQDERVGFYKYDALVTQYAPAEIIDYSSFAINNVSSPIFTTIHGLEIGYKDRLDVVEAFQENLNISKLEALKQLLTMDINNLNVDLDYEFSMAETAIEILGCMRLVEKLVPKPKICPNCGVEISKNFCTKCGYKVQD